MLSPSPFLFTICVSMCMPVHLYVHYMDVGARPHGPELRVLDHLELPAGVLGLKLSLLPTAASALNL